MAITLSPSLRPTRVARRGDEPGAVAQDARHTRVASEVAPLGERGRGFARARRLVDAPAPSRTQTVAPTSRDRLSIRPVEVLGMLRDGRIDVDIPLVPGPVVEALGLNIVEITEGSHLRVRLEVHDGVISTDKVWHEGREQWATQAWIVDEKGDVSAIDGPLWFNGRGAYIDDKRRLRADIQGFFDLNIAPMVAEGTKRTPARLADFLSLFVADGGPEITLLRPEGGDGRSGQTPTEPGRFAKLLDLDGTTFHFRGIDDATPARLNGGRIELGDGSFVTLEQGTEVTVRGRPDDLTVSLRGGFDAIDLGHRAARLKGAGGTWSGTLRVSKPARPDAPAQVDLRVDELALEDVTLSHAGPRGVDQLRAERLDFGADAGDGRGVSLKTGGPDAAMTLSLPVALDGAQGTFPGMTDQIGTGKLVLGRERPGRWRGRIEYDTRTGLDVIAEVDHLDAAIDRSTRTEPKALERLDVEGSATIGIHADRERLVFDARTDATVQTQLHVGDRSDAQPLDTPELPAEPLGDLAAHAIPEMRPLPPPPQFADNPRFELLQPSAPPEVLLWPTQALRGVEKILVEVTLPAHALELPFDFGEVRTERRLGIEDEVGTVGAIVAQRDAGPIRFNLSIEEGALTESDRPLVVFEPPLNIPVASLTAHLPYAPGEVSLSGSLRVRGLRLAIDAESGKGYLVPELDLEEARATLGDDPKPGKGLRVRRLLEKLDSLASHLPSVGEGGIVGMVLGKAIFGTYPLPPSVQELLTHLDAKHPGLAGNIELPLWDPPVGPPPPSNSVPETPKSPGRLLRPDEISAEPGAWYLVQHGATVDAIATKLLGALDIEVTSHRVAMLRGELGRLNRLDPRSYALGAGDPLRMPTASTVRRLLGVPTPPTPPPPDQSPLRAALDVDGIEVRVAGLRFTSHTIDLGQGQYIHLAEGSQLDVDVQPGPPRRIHLRGKASFAATAGERGGLRVGRDPIDEDRPDGTFGIAMDDGAAEMDLVIEQPTDPSAGPRISLKLTDLSSVGFRAAAEAKGVRTLIHGPASDDRSTLEGGTVVLEIPGNGPPHIDVDFPDFAGHIAARGELRPMDQPSPFHLDVAGRLHFVDGAVQGELSRVDLDVRGLDLRTTGLVAFGDKPVVMGDQVSLRGPVAVATDEAGLIRLTRPKAGPNAGEAMVLDAALTMLDGSKVQIKDGQASSLTLNVALPEVDLADVSGELDLLMRVGPQEVHIDVPQAHVESGRIVVGSRGINVEQLALTRATGRVGNIPTGENAQGLAFDQLNFDDQAFLLTFHQRGELSITAPDGPFVMSPSSARIDDLVVAPLGLRAGLDPRRTQITSAELDEIRFDTGNSSSKTGSARWSLRNVVIESLVDHLDVDLDPTTEAREALRLTDGKLRVELDRIDGSLGGYSPDGQARVGFLGTARLEGNVAGDGRPTGTRLDGSDRRMLIDADGRLRAIARIRLDGPRDVDATVTGRFRGGVRIETRRSPSN